MLALFTQEMPNLEKIQRLLHKCTIGLYSQEEIQYVEPLQRIATEIFAFLTSLGPLVYISG